MSAPYIGRRAVGTVLVASLVAAASFAQVRPRLRERVKARSCGSLQPLTTWPSSGYLLEMEAVGEVFHVWVTSPDGTARVAS